MRLLTRILVVASANLYKVSLATFGKPLDIQQRIVFGQTALNVVGAVQLFVVSRKEASEALEANPLPL